VPSLPKVKNLEEKTSPAFRAKLYRIATELGLPPGELAALMGFESSWTFAPDVRNPSGGATGLIQFMPSTATRLGTTTADLAKMSAFDQLDYVKKYLAGMGKWRVPGDSYLMVFWPSGVGKPDDFLIGEKGNLSLVPGAQFSRNKVYEQNKGLDANGDGRITAGDVRRKVLTILAQSEAAGSIEVDPDDESLEASKSAEGAVSFGVLGAVAAAALGVVAALAARAAGYLGGRSR
jgi:hypothetical protein